MGSATQHTDHTTPLLGSFSGGTELDSSQLRTTRFDPMPTSGCCVTDNGGGEIKKEKKKCASLKTASFQQVLGVLMCSTMACALLRTSPFSMVCLGQVFRFRSQRTSWRCQA